MEGLGRFTELLWLLTVVAEGALLGVLVRTGAMRQYPALCTYMCVALGQSALLFASYEIWGFAATISWWVAWATQAIVLVTRAWVVIEICKHVLGCFRGIWALARWVLLACGFLVMGFAASVGYRQRGLPLNTTEAGLELAIAAVIVFLLLFSRYYAIEIMPPVRWLAAGFCFYSCGTVLNDMVLARWLSHYAPMWNAASMFAFLGCLAGWTYAFVRWKPVPRETPAIDRDTYRLLIPEMNWQLRALNEHLIRFWRVEAPGA